MRWRDSMMCIALETLERGETALAAAQVCQCFKAMHEFSKMAGGRRLCP